MKIKEMKTTKEIGAELESAFAKYMKKYRNHSKFQAPNGVGSSKHNEIMVF